MKISIENPHSHELRIIYAMHCFFCWCNVLFKSTPLFKWFVIWSETDNLCHIAIVCCLCVIESHVIVTLTELLIRNLLFFVLFQLTTLQAHTMAPMSLFCTRFLKSLLVKEDTTSNPQPPQSDDDEDEQMHSDDDWKLYSWNPEHLPTNRQMAFEIVNWKCTSISRQCKRSFLICFWEVKFCK